MLHLSNDHKDCPNQHKINHNVWDETVHAVVVSLTSQWKLRQKHDHNFPMEGKPL